MRHIGVGVWLISAGLLVVAGVVAAEEFRAEASVDRPAVAVGEALTLTITIYGGGEVSEPGLSGIDGFRIVNTSSSQSFSIVNMKMSRSQSLQYTLLALEAGEFVLGPFAVRSGDEVYETEQLKVTVTQGGVVPPSSSQQRVQAPSDDDLVLLSASVDKRRVYVDEQVTYTLKFAYRARLDNTQYTPPDHTGFWFEDMGRVGPGIETIDGERYYVTRHHTAFFPISAGRFSIGEAAVRYVMRDLSPFSRDPFSVFNRDPFDVFGRKEGMAKTKPIEIEAVPLPMAGRPSDFTGAVGRFRFSVAPSAREIKVGESLTVSLKIEGDGNLKSIGEIPIPEIRDFRVFAPKARETITSEGLRVGGEKIFDLVLVPQAAGTYTLEGFSFSYFDPGTERYATLTADPVTVKVLPGDIGVAGTSPGSASEVLAARREIRYIKRGVLDTNELSLRLDGIKGMLVRYLPLVIALVGIVIGVQRKRTVASGRAAARKAYKLLNHDLKAAERMIQSEHQVAEASGLISRGIRSYLAARTGAGTASIDEAAVASIPGFSPESRESMGKLLAELDRIRFAPVAPDAAAMVAVLERARRLLKKVGGEWNE